MTDWSIETDIAAIAVVLACCLRVLERFTTGRWKHRFETIGSPLLKAPAYRVLFVLVLVGVMLISVLPEAAFVLPALDAVGLDIVTILAALELRHYLASVARLVRMRTNPVLWLYACMWPVIWIRTLKGTMGVSPRSSWSAG